LGKELGLFIFHPWAPGATFWDGKGTVLYNTLASYMRDVLLPTGWIEVKTPLVYNKALWEMSGHWQHYRQNMFLIESENEQMGMKAMNCPGQYLLYASRTHSYRELPLRFHEQTPLHRNEASGVLAGLTRVRQFAQDDGHSFLMQDQIGDEVERMLGLVQRIYGDFGLEYTAKLSTRPPDSMGEIATWDSAEAQLKSALDKSGQPYTINEGDGAADRGSAHRVRGGRARSAESGRLARRSRRPAGEDRFQDPGGAAAEDPLYASRRGSRSR